MSVLFAGVCGCDGVFLSLLSAYCEKFLHDKRLVVRKNVYFLSFGVSACRIPCVALFLTMHIGLPDTGQV